MLSPVIQKCFVGTLTLALGLSLMVWEPVSFPTTLDFSQLYVSLERAYDGGALYRLDRALDAATSGDGELQGAFPFAGPPGISHFCSRSASSHPRKPLSRGRFSMSGFSSLPLRSYVSVLRQ